MSTRSYTYVIGGPCGCCPITPPANTLECRTRGGSAVLCGFDENVGYESSPPKRYKTKTLSGGWSYDRFTTGACALLACNETAAFSGACVIDPSVTCFIPVSAASVTFTGCSPLTKATCGITSDRNPCGDFVTTIDATSVAITLGSSACTGACEGISANALQVLTDEDTEADAIARVIIDSPWGAWLSGTTAHCTCSWEIRSTGYSFTYIEAQFKYTAAGLAPSTPYTLTLDVYQRAFGSGGYTMIGTTSSSFSTDGSGNAVITGDVPITQGYDTYVTNPVVT